MRREDLHGGTKEEESEDALDLIWSGVSLFVPDILHEVGDKNQGRMGKRRKEIFYFRTSTLGKRNNPKEKSNPIHKIYKRDKRKENNK